MDELSGRLRVRVHLVPRRGVEGRQPAHDLLGEDEPVRPFRLTAAAALGALLLASGCASEEPEAAPSASPQASPSTAPAAPAPPEVGSCHALDLEAATSPVDTSAPVAC